MAKLPKVPCPNCGRKNWSTAGIARDRYYRKCLTCHHQGITDINGVVLGYAYNLVPRQCPKCHGGRFLSASRTTRGTWRKCQDCGFSSAVDENGVPLPKAVRAKAPPKPKAPRKPRIVQPRVRAPKPPKPAPPPNTPAPPLTRHLIEDLLLSRQRIKDPFED